MSLIIIDIVDADLKWGSMIDKVLCLLIIEAVYCQTIL